MATPVACLYGETVPADALASYAAQYSMTSAPAGAAPNGQDKHNILLLSPADMGKMPALVLQPYHAYVELIDGEEPGPLNTETLEALAAGKLCFSFATNTIYQMDSANLICEALSSRGVLSAMRRSDVELSLHESISNAVVHGNLNLASNMKGDFSNYAKFAQELQQRMSSPEAKRRVDVICAWDHEFLDITICDKGNGYDESMLPANVDPFAPAGRGLAIMRSLTLAMNVTHGGRVTTLRFLT